MDGKVWWQSKTVWSIVLIVVGMILNHWHLQIADPDGTAQMVADNAGTVVAAFGTLGAVYGRATAKGPLVIKQQ